MRLNGRIGRIRRIASSCERRRSFMGRLTTTAPTPARACPVQPPSAIRPAPPSAIRPRDETGRGAAPAEHGLGRQLRVEDLELDVADGLVAQRPLARPPLEPLPDAVADRVEQPLVHLRRQRVVQQHVRALRAVGAAADGRRGGAQVGAMSHARAARQQGSLRGEVGKSLCRARGAPLWGSGPTEGSLAKEGVPTRPSDL